MIAENKPPISALDRPISELLERAKRTGDYHAIEAIERFVKEVEGD